MEDKIYPLIIVGAGPAGYSASIYSSRYKIEHLIIGELPGGLITEAHKVCNYPGFPEISGMELGQRFQKQAQELGVEEINKRIGEIIMEEGVFRLRAEGDDIYKAKRVLLATGTVRRKLDVKGEKELLGKGVSYCATCDAFFYKDKIVGVIGGSNAATTAALYLSEVAKKVFLIYRRDKLRGDKTWIENVHKKENIEIIYNTNVTEFRGEERLESLLLDNVYKNSKILTVNGVFVEIGSIPYTAFTKELGIEQTKGGYIKVNKDQSTNVPNLYAAGDITDNSNNFRQVITATAEGAVAANAIYKGISKNG